MRITPRLQVKCMRNNHFSRPCLSTFFIKRERTVTKGSATEWGTGPTYTQGTITFKWLRDLRAYLEHLQLALAKTRYISSAILDNTSLIVWTQRSKILLFLSFQRSQETKTTRESKHLRPSLGMGGFKYTCILMHLFFYLIS